MTQQLQSNLIQLFFGFALTTVVGGLLASFLQTRLWRHQWAAQRANQASEAAKALFEDVSGIMDKRLFRLSQLQLWMRRGDATRLAAAMTDYREVLREWNDSINRDLSLLQFYFGTEVRKKFDFGVGLKFVQIGALAEEMFRALPTKSEEQDRRLSDQIEGLRSDVYQYNLKLLDCMDRIHKESEPKFVPDFLSRNGSTAKQTGSAGPEAGKH